ncbi:ly6/PLAUR domain-containing protein 6-like [Chanos chanos]|uniref:Ly6/PLAUR domain-containing protein 6-like n=1 Tax=Chanos chanos TaxID=29144 RepID=A0A6J2V6V5_CHACN|nr:ly6/PLAUR domain-containing protein 6-like [Chanos chanos]
MVTWVRVAWVLCLMLTSDWMKTTHSRDFTLRDIIYLHPSTTPYPGGFKCFTCEDAEDNYSCNRWAPDTYCPRGTSYCYTRHKMDMHGDSVSVTKRCVSLEDCLSTGCVQDSHKGYQVCTACCEGNICNLPLPRNETTAIFSTILPLNRKSKLSVDWPLCFLIIILIVHTFTHI